MQFLQDRLTTAPTALNTHVSPTVNRPKPKHLFQVSKPSQGAGTFPALTTPQPLCLLSCIQYSQKTDLLLSHTALCSRCSLSLECREAVPLAERLQSLSAHHRGLLQVCLKAYRHLSWAGQSSK